MRITGGNARGILLDVPRDVGCLRPATDFLREAVFSSIGRAVQKSLVLDTFAGVGSYGLEALSRGADGCVFVEKSRSAVDAIEWNIKKVRKSTARNFTTKVLCQDIFVFAESCSAEFDVIFIDPPYNMVENRGSELLEIFSKFLKGSTTSRLIFEVPGSHKFEESCNVIELRRLGRTSNSRQPNAVIYGKKQHD
ncbi:MAG: RsmD family RNA methyltransferase [Puniceicoccales bacterium]|jgi:16S rRNA (guanine966-N2)-methyltransferase|nr:RsmD family RNA methyltransferase [Puniceicoccales bacterium]